MSLLILNDSYLLDKFGQKVQFKGQFIIFTGKVARADSWLVTTVSLRLRSWRNFVSKKYWPGNTLCVWNFCFILLMSVQQPQEHQSYFRAFGLYYLAHNSSIIDNKRSSLTCTVQLSRRNIFLDKKSIKIEKLPLALKCWYFPNPFQLSSPPESIESSQWFYSNIILP